MTKWNRRLGIAVAFVTLVSSGVDAGDGTRALERIRALEGEWVGVTWWSNDPDRRDAVTLTYHTTGRDSAVVEEFQMQGQSLMTTIYHLDGQDLRATHFCTHNQPRLKASSISDDAIGFDFVDATNLASPDAGHVSGLEVRTPEPDRLHVRFTYTRAGVDVYEYIELTRSEATREAR